MYAPKIPYDINKPSDAAQVECLAQASTHRGFGIFFQQRVGKTRIAVDVIGSAIAEGAKRVLIVSPLCAQAGWQYQVKQYLGKTGFKTKMGTAKVSSHILPKADDPVIVLTTYDKMTLGSKDYTTWKPDVVILDEVHLIKNRTSRRSKVAAKVCKDAIRVLGLTGTPYSNRSYQDLFGIFRAVNPELFGTKWVNFENEYCVKGGYMGYEVVGYKYVEKMLAIVDSNSMRVLRKDIMDEPETEDISVIVELDTAERKFYTQMQKDSVLLLSGEPRVTADMVTTQRTKLQQITSGSVKDDEGIHVRVGKSKLEILKDLVNMILEEDFENKIVISCRYTADVRMVEEYVGGQIITGSIDASMRNTRLERWRAGVRGSNILVFQEQTMSMGVDLSLAHHMIFFSWGEDSIVHSQVRDRLMGRYQKSEVVHYHYLICKKTIDELMYKSLKGNISKAQLAADWKKWIMP